MKITICSDAGIADDSLREITAILGCCAPGGQLELTLGRQEKGLCAAFDGKTARLSFSRLCELFRAAGLFAQHFGKEETFCIREEASFSRLCLMADNSRNAVLNADAARRLIRVTALMGYTALMLYTEDTYELRDYPYFGYMRGRFTSAELRELDAYAARFGIELIPCIQTLAHLNAALRWPAFEQVHDCDDILLAGEEKTYALIEAMLQAAAENFASREINIGMDEAEMIGLGRYLAQNGFQNRTEIMLRHLERVAGLCEKYGFKPMMWSDMFFKLAGGGEYRPAEGGIPEEIRRKVPKNVTLVYWDYFMLDESEYARMLDGHLEFDNPVAFAGGAWKWSGFAPSNGFSFRASRAALAACRQKGIGEVLVTAWGDNGAECGVFSILPTLQLYAEECYRPGTGTEELAARLKACAGAELADFLLLDLPNLTPGSEEPDRCGLNPSRYLLYQDVLCGLFDRHVQEGEFNAHYAAAAEKLRDAAGRAGVWAYLFETLAALCGVLALKCDLGVRLKAAYDRGDTRALRAAAKELPELTRRLDEFRGALRAQWMKENKAFGFEVLDIRLGGLRARLETASLRLKEYLAGRIPMIEELEPERLRFDGAQDGEPGTIHANVWRRMVSAGEI